MTGQTVSRSKTNPLEDIHLSLDQPLPDQPKISKRYCDQFNRVAKDLKIQIEWTDKHNPLFVDGDEIQFLNGSETTYQANLEQLQTDITTVLNKVEEDRAALVQKSVEAFQTIDMPVDISSLTPAEQTVVLRIRDVVKPLIDSIEAMQNQPDVDTEAAYLKEHPNAHSDLAFEWLHHDMGFGFTYYLNQANFSLVWYYPDLPPINGMIDPSITLEDFTAIAATQPDTDERLRATTALSRNKNGEIIAKPLPRVPAFREDHLDLAKKWRALPKPQS